MREWPAGTRGGDRDHERGSGPKGLAGARDRERGSGPKGLAGARGCGGAPGPFRLNYDSTTATDYKHCGFRYEDPRQEELSDLSYAWTRAHTSLETKAWLGTLPFRLDARPLGGHLAGPTLILVHGAPTLNTLYRTEDRSDDFCRKVVGRAGGGPRDLLAFGHTYLPWPPGNRGHLRYAAASTSASSRA